MKILVLGAGAVGGYFGGRLAQLLSSKYGCSVTFLVRPNRGKQLLDDGLLLDDRGTVETISSVRTITDATTCDQHFDVIILTCKSYGLDGALEAIAPIVENNVGVAILPLLNGMAHLEKITQRFPTAIVWGGTCGIVATLTPEGIVKKLTEAQFIVAGVRSDDDTQKKDLLQSLIQCMQQAGIEATFSDTIDTKMWEKWTFLTTLAAATCLLDGTIGEILSTDHGATYIKGVYEECNQVATAALGVPLDVVEQTKKFKRVLGDPNSIVRASMARDLQNGNPTEADHVVGDMIERAQHFGIATPQLSVAYTRLQVYENQRNQQSDTKQA